MEIESKIFFTPLLFALLGVIFLLVSSNRDQTRFKIGKGYMVISVISSLLILIYYMYR